MVLPIATGSSAFDSWIFPKTDLAFTSEAFAFGISTPIAPLPGIGAIILIPLAAKASAISFSRPTIRLILTPGAGTIS